MLEFVLGFLTAAALYGIYRIITGHKHEYEVLFHRLAKDIDFLYSWETYSYFDSINFSPDKDCVFVTYKKCNRCNNVVVSVGDGTPRTYRFNAYQLRDKIEAIMKHENKIECETLLKSVNDKLDSKYDSMLTKEKQTVSV